jgi:hypothetical protein
MDLRTHPGEIMRTLFATFALTLFLASLVISLQAAELTVASSDTLQSLLVAQKGKTVTLRLSGGQELTGVVREATTTLVVLGSLSGREFFDAAIDLAKVEALIVRNQ